MAIEHVLDCQGLSCPQPVIQTKEKLDALQAGEKVEVIVDNEGSCSNVQRFAESQGHAVDFKRNGANYHINITKGAGPADQPEPEIVCDTTQNKKIVIHVASEFMGRGDDVLGTILMKAYFELLSHFAKDITHITLVNSGVRLATEGSPVLDHIKEMEHMGIAILSCGTCLDHYGIKEKLAAGEVSNMFTILDAQSSAGAVLSP